jgi:hypothetical protein
MRLSDDKSELIRFGWWLPCVYRKPHPHLMSRRNHLTSPQHVSAALLRPGYPGLAIQFKEPACFHVSGKGDGYSRSADLSRIAMAERFIGTLRRECLDQVVIFSEMHLRQILSTYAAYYNQVRMHLALE